MSVFDDSVILIIDSKFLFSIIKILTAYASAVSVENSY